MVLLVSGHVKYFDPDFLKLLADKKDNEVIDILNNYQNQSPLKLGQLKDNFGETLLHHAAKYDNVPVVQYLLDSGCNIDAQDNLGRTPLILAVTEVREVVFEFLLKANAKINLTDCRSKNTLENIFELHGSTCLRMLRKFFQTADWYEVIKGISPYDLAMKLSKAYCTSITALKWDNIQLTKFLVVHEIATGARTPHNPRTLIHLAIQERKLKMAKVLIESGVNIDALDWQKSIPLYYLYDENFPMKKSESAEYLEILELLVNRSALLTTSAKNGLMQIAKVLYNATDKAIEILLRANIDLNATDGWGNTPIHYLARNRKAVDFHGLLRGRKFNINARNNYETTPLLFSAEYNSFNAMKFLLESGAEVDAVNKGAVTSLYRAFNRVSSSDDNENSVRILLEYGADPQTYVRSEFYNQCYTIFDSVIKSARAVFGLDSDFNFASYLSKAEPLLARLAIIEGLGLEITELTRSKINLQPSWTKHFDTCRVQVEQMKTNKFYGNISLFEFLTENWKKASVHARNDELVYKLEKAIEEFVVNSPYPDLLRRRLERANKLVHLKRKSIIAICRLINGRNNGHYFTAEYIVDYLSNTDMTNLLLVWNQ